MPNLISEQQIEQALVQKLQFLHGFEVLDCHSQSPEDLNDGSNRTHKRDVILLGRVREAAVRLNPDIPAKAIDEALERLIDRRLAMSLIAANEEVYHLIRDGIPVEFDDANGRLDQGRVKVIDFTDTTKNDYLAVTQLWIQGTRGFRRPDVLLYVNGMPLVFIELKNSNVSVRNAYDDNLTNYRAEIPQLFHCNAFCILSNALETRVGSVTADWEHFFPWLRVDDETDPLTPRLHSTPRANSTRPPQKQFPSRHRADSAQCRNGIARRLPRLPLLNHAITHAYCHYEASLTPRLPCVFHPCSCLRSAGIPEAPRQGRWPARMGRLRKRRRGMESAHRRSTAAIRRRCRPPAPYRYRCRTGGIEPPHGSQGGT